MTNPDNAGGLPAPDYYIVRSDGATLLFTSKASANAQMHELTSKGYRCSLEPVATLETLRAYGELCRAAPAGGVSCTFAHGDDWPCSICGTPRKDSAPAGSGEVEQMAKRLDDERAIEEETGGLEDTIDAMRTAAALLRKLQQGADYVMVPRVPSDAMLDAALTVSSFRHYTQRDAERARYAAMIAASQGQEGGNG